MEQVLVSARRIKSLNPSTNITVVTNPGIRPEVEGVFDVVRTYVIATLHLEDMPRYTETAIHLSLYRHMIVFPHEQAMANKRRRVLSALLSRKAYQPNKVVLLDKDAK